MAAGGFHKTGRCTCMSESGACGIVDEDWGLRVSLGWAAMGVSQLEVLGRSHRVGVCVVRGQGQARI